MPVSKIKLVDPDDDEFDFEGNDRPKENYMDKRKQYKAEPQVSYLGRLVNRNHFRAFVYGAPDKMHLANNYDEYEKLVASGVWFESLQALHDAINAEKPAKAKRRVKNTEIGVDVNNVDVPQDVEKLDDANS